jgi:hypothetical protein
VVVLDENATWEKRVSDSSYGLTPHTCGRGREMLALVSIPQNCHDSTNSLPFSTGLQNADQYNAGGLYFWVIEYRYYLVKSTRA